MGNAPRNGIAERKEMRQTKNLTDIIMNKKTQ